MEITFRREKSFYFRKCRCYNLPYNETKERIYVAKVVNIFPSMDEDMKDYHKKIWRHRVSLILKYAAVVAVVLLAIF